MSHNPSNGWRLRTRHWFYATILIAVAIQFIGPLGIAVAGLLLLVWHQVFSAASRESAAFGDSSSNSFRSELILGLLVACVAVAAVLPPVPDSDPLRQARLCLKRISLAIDAFESEHHRLPSTCVASAEDLKSEPLGWQVELLPMLGHSLLFDKISNARSVEERKQLSSQRPIVYSVWSSEQGRDASSVLLFPYDGGGPDQDGFVLCEHEVSVHPWMSVQPALDQCVELSQDARFGKGFWNHGFFISEHRGRLAIINSKPIIWHDTHETRGLSNAQLLDYLDQQASLEAAEWKKSNEGSVTPSSLLETPVEIGHPLRVFHLSRLVMFAAFIVTALFPICYLRRFEA